MAASPSNQDDLVLPEAEENPWNAPSNAGDAQAAHNDSEEPARKKPRRDVLQDAASKQRNQRMFGVVMGTLNKFKAEGSKQKQSEAAKRRTDLEDRLATKLQAERKDLEVKSHRFRTERQLKLDVVKKEDDKLTLQAMHKTRQQTALQLANFLCTGPASAADREAHSTAIATIPFQPGQPQHAASTLAVPTIYYRPAKLLSDQEDRIARQKEDANKLVDADREAWAREVRQLNEELAELRQKRDSGLEDLEREERAQRAEREREARDREDEEEPNGRDRDGDAAMEDAADS